MLIALPVLGLAALLAQAEPAPPEGPVGGQQTPAPRAPAPAGPAEPAPPEPAPAEAAPQAPAPPSEIAPPPRRPLPPPPNGLSVLIGLSRRLGDDSPINPASGFSLGGTFERRYASPASTVELGAALDFFFDQFVKTITVPGPLMNGVPTTIDNARTINATTFALLQTLGTRVDRLRLWVAAGGGLAIHYFNGSGSSSAYLPFARGVLGGDVEVRKNTAVGLRVGYSFMLKSSSSTTDDNGTLPLFGDLLDINAGLFYRF